MGPPNNSVVNPIVEELTCEDETGPFDPNLFNVTVATLPHLLTPKLFPRPLLSHKKWILDIDLDFFTTADPTLAMFAQYGFTTNWVTYHVHKTITCLNGSSE